MNIPERKDHPQRVSGNQSGIRKMFFFLYSDCSPLLTLPCSCDTPNIQNQYKSVSSTCFFYHYFPDIFFTSADFVLEITSSLIFFVDYIRGKPSTRSNGGGKMDFGEAFGISTARKPTMEQMAPVRPKQEEEAILLSPYPFASTEPKGSVQ